MEVEKSAWEHLCFGLAFSYDVGGLAKRSWDPVEDLGEVVRVWKIDYEER